MLSWFHLSFYEGIHHAKFQGHGYFFSWEHPKTKNLTVNWLTGRNICRRHCMDLVSLGINNSYPYEFIKNKSIFVVSRLFLYFQQQKRPKKLNFWNKNLLLVLNDLRGLLDANATLTDVTARIYNQLLSRVGFGHLLALRYHTMKQKQDRSVPGVQQEEMEGHNQTIESYDWRYI